LTWISRTQPSSVVTTASKYSGALDREEQEREPAVGSRRKPSAGNQIVSGRPTSTGSSGAIIGSRAEDRVAPPGGCGCTVNDPCAEQALPP
jgi:hypothetical protein